VTLEDFSNIIAAGWATAGNIADPRTDGYGFCSGDASNANGGLFTAIQPGKQMVIGSNIRNFRSMQYLLTFVQDTNGAAVLLSTLADDTGHGMDGNVPDLRLSQRAAALGLAVRDRSDALPVHQSAYNEIVSYPHGHVWEDARVVDVAAWAGWRCAGRGNRPVHPCERLARRSLDDPLGDMVNPVEPCPHPDRRWQCDRDPAAHREQYRQRTLRLPVYDQSGLRSQLLPDSPLPGCVEFRLPHERGNRERWLDLCTPKSGGGRPEQHRHRRRVLELGGWSNLYRDDRGSGCPISVLDRREQHQHVRVADGRWRVPGGPDAVLGHRRKRGLRAERRRFRPRGRLSAQRGAADRDQARAVPQIWTGGATLASDTFTDTNSTRLNAHTPTLGGAWTETPSVTGNIWEIQGNKAKNTHDAAHGNGMAYQSVGVLDAECQVDISTPATFTTSWLSAIAFRVVNASNYGYVALLRHVSQPGADEVECHEVIAGVDTVVHKPNVGSAWSTSSTYTEKLQVRGDKVQVYVDGKPRATFFLSPSFLAVQGTGFGLFSHATDEGLTFDNWTVKAL
jgi:hypothetical protein